PATIPRCCRTRDRHRRSRPGTERTGGGRLRRYGIWLSEICPSAAPVFFGLPVSYLALCPCEVNQMAGGLRAAICLGGVPPVPAASPRDAAAKSGRGQTAPCGASPAPAGSC